MYAVKTWVSWSQLTRGVGYLEKKINKDKLKREVCGKENGGYIRKINMKKKRRYKEEEEEEQSTEKRRGRCEGEGKRRVKIKEDEVKAEEERKR